MMRALVKSVFMAGLSGEIAAAATFFHRPRYCFAKHNLRPWPDIGQWRPEMASNRNQAKPAFVSRPEVLAVLPEISGNTVNGVGESVARRASPVMWHDSEIIAHGALQDWYRTQGPSPGARNYMLQNRALSEKPLPEIAPDRPDWSAGEAAARVKEAALARESDLVGIARMNPDWVFEGYEADYAWIVVLVVAMDHEELSQAPSDRSQTEVQKQYDRGSRAAIRLAGWMREAGWDALPHGGPAAGPVLMIPPAIEAGLGELGKHGSMINRVYGSSFRLASVLTDMPLVADRPDIFGADAFCTSCQLCRDQMVRRFRRMHPVFRRAPGLRGVSADLPVEPSWRRPASCREDEPARYIWRMRRP
jgi:hypothetical protein